MGLWDESTGALALVDASQCACSCSASVRKAVGDCLADIVDRPTRSLMMSAIRGKNTAPELRVRQFLHAMGLRFRLHSRRLAGSPDITLKKYRVAIFVHGCFWHRHPGCRFSYMPKSRIAFWRRKFRENVARDERNRREVRAAGWRPLTVWECQVNDERHLKRLLKEIVGGRQ